ncbi:hypothetical protein Lal_00012221 [Lupinus albus]|nr:hypothetical protein Lal_00012221 [Lupinus albus]
MVGMRKDHKVGGGVGGTCEVTKNQTQHSPSDFGSSNVENFGSSNVASFGSSYVASFGSSDVASFGSSDVASFGSSDVASFGSSNVESFGSSDIASFGSSDVANFGSSYVAWFSKIYGQVENDKKNPRDLKSRKNYIVWDVPEEDSTSSTSSEEESTKLCKTVKSHISCDSNEQEESRNIHSSKSISSSEYSSTYDELYGAYVELHEELKKIAKIEKE